MYADRKKRATNSNDAIKQINQSNKMRSIDNDDAIKLISQSNKILLLELDAVKKELQKLKYEKLTLQNRFKEENAALVDIFKEIHDAKERFNNSSNNVNNSTNNSNVNNEFDTNILSKLVDSKNDLSVKIVETVINESSNNLKQLIDSKLNNATTINYNNDDYVNALKQQNESLMKSVFTLTEENKRLRNLLTANDIDAGDDKGARPIPKLREVVKSVVKLNKSKSNNDITNTTDTTNTSLQSKSKETALSIETSGNIINDDDSFYQLSDDEQNTLWNSLRAFIKPFVVNFPSSQLDDYAIDQVTEEVALEMISQIAKLYISTDSNVDRILQSSFIVNEIVAFVTLFATYLDSKT